MEKNGDQGIYKSIPKKIDYFMNTKNWWGPLTFILIISLLGVGMIAFQTYTDAPPMVGFKDGKGQPVFDQKVIERGQEVFHKYALMEYGSYFGDGAQRGPDFTAQALHKINEFMNQFYQKDFAEKNKRNPNAAEMSQIAEQVRIDLKKTGMPVTERWFH
ncbi:MAG: hypothetical protein U0T81_08625 [Saprospiraceae bacterium]